MAAKAEIIRVLLLEDNMSMRMIIQTILHGLGAFEIHEAADAVAASRIVRERRIDLALVDFQLQDGDGVQFVRDVRRSPSDQLRFLPIIMVTGHSERLRVEEARDAGVSEFVADGSGADVPAGGGGHAPASVRVVSGLFRSGPSPPSRGRVHRPVPPEG
jgi:CheY-like chemotaxis protein